MLTGAGFSESGSFKSLKLFGPEGCDECTRGYKGRTGVFQVMPVTEAIAELIVQNTGQESIEKQSIAEGIITMRQAGLVKVRAGVTSLEEVLRVTDT